MLLEMTLFIGSVLSGVTFLAIRAACVRTKSKLPVDFKKSDIYSWAGPEVISEINIESNSHTDFMLSPDTKLALILLSAFMSPLIS